MLFSQHVDYAFSGAAAHKYGIQAAMVLNRIIWSINYHEERRRDYEEKYYVDGSWWMEDTYESISNHFNGLIGQSTVKKYILKFERDGLLLSRKRRATIWDQTKWYSINGAEWDALHGKQPRNSIGYGGAYQQATVEPIKALPGSSSSSLNSHTYNLTNTSAIFEQTPEILELAKTWHEFALREMKWTKPPKSWSVETFAQELKQIMKLENANIEGMRALLKFIEGGFWATVITTPKGLSKKNPEGVRRITTIFKQMKTKSQRQEEKHEAMSEEEKQRIDDEVANMFGFGGNK